MHIGMLVAHACRCVREHVSSCLCAYVHVAHEHVVFVSIFLRVMAKIRNAAEKAKVVLSANSDTHIVVCKKMENVFSMCMYVQLHSVGCTFFVC